MKKIYYIIKLLAVSLIFIVTSFIIIKKERYANS